ncbi:MAG: HEAT repeat domain-containing protein [Oscillatoria sp. SIO1A7]|nr:HEAT repeat domain-containing protein [Oscillatoria sp. SIO1A7]
MFLTKSKRIDQVRAAVQEENWSQLNQLLTQLVGALEKPAEDGPSSIKEIAFSNGNISGKGHKSQSQDIIDLPQILDLALKILIGGDFQARWDAAKTFPRLGQIAIAPLMAILQDERADSELRWFAGRILGEFEDPEAVQALIQLLETDEDEELSIMAADALAHIGFRAIKGLESLLAEPSSRLLAVRSLARIRRREIINPLLSVVGDADPSVRAAAIEALANFDEPQILPALVAALEDLATGVRREATIGLGLWAVRSSSPLPPELDIVELLEERLWDFNLEVCQQAALALSRLQTLGAAAALARVLQSPSTPVPLQLSVLRSLGWMGTKEALDYLRGAMLDSPNPVSDSEALPEAIRVLGRIENKDLRPKATEILIGLLQLEEPPAAMRLAKTKQQIALALGYLGSQEAIDPLINMLADANTAVRLHTIHALKRLNPQGLRQQLEQLTANENLTPEMKQGLAIALVELS